jgi:NADPH:quinone reductase-like Zn-dependent oxidoreductase
VPAAQVQIIGTHLPSSLSWAILGALPEMMQTAWGSLKKALRLETGDHLLIRGGTTSVGLAASALAKAQGATVAATTRNASREELLRRSGADQVFIDDGSITDQVRQSRPGGFDKVLELIGVTTLEDSLRCARQGGIVCMTGIVGNSWTFDTFAPMEAIPTAVSLTTYSGGADDFIHTPFPAILEEIITGKLHVQIGRTFHLDEIVEAHRCMEYNAAGGKIVILT